MAQIAFLIIFYCNMVVLISCSQTPKQFIYNGFSGSNLHLDGSTKILPNGALALTNTTQQKGHAFYPQPLNLSSSPLLSTTFAFSIVPESRASLGHGLAFVVAPSTDFSGATDNEWLGLLNSSNNGLPSNHIFAVELDTFLSTEFNDINGNHVGIDVNSLDSTASASAEYYSEKRKENVSLDLASGKPMQVWIDYDSRETLVKVAMAPLGEPKPSQLLLSTRVNLSEVLLDTIYVGFSAATGTLTESNYLIGWSFSQSGEAEEFDLSKLPKAPGSSNKRKIRALYVVLLSVLALLIGFVGVVYRMRRNRYEEVMEDWEREYVLQRLSYKDLYKATEGFKDARLLGVGGFGKVYRGVLRSTDFEVAIKRLSHGSRQGVKEFVAEIASMRRLRHRNLVPLLGYCRRKEELLLVYEYMANGSLDKILFSKEKPVLSWQQRFKIIKGVASALLYLHEEWEQVVVHRDVKASNILLDGEMEARLGDFGLARFHNHGSDLHTTNVVGTVGYLAPELPRTGKATTSTDVFAFGTFALEVACGRKPIETECRPDQVILVDWVHECWKSGVVLEVSDPRLEGNYDADEMTRVLELGLLCSDPRPEARLSIRQVMQLLNGDPILPEIPLELAEMGQFGPSDGQSNSWFSDESRNSRLHCTLNDIS